METITTETQIDSILKTLNSILNLEFTQKATLKGNGDSTDAIASSINILSEHIQTLIKKEKDKSDLLNKSEEISCTGSWVLDLLNNQLTWSDEVYRIFGLLPQEFTATYEAFLDAIHPEDRAQVDAAYTNSIKENIDGYEIEHRLFKKNTNEIKYVFEKCKHERDHSGKIIRSVGFVKDITEKKKAEYELIEYKNKLEQKVNERTAQLLIANNELIEKEFFLKQSQNAGKIGSYKVDFTNKYFQSSDTLDNIFGISKNYVRSLEGWLNLVHPDDKQMMNDYLQNEVLGKGKKFDKEYRILKANNKQLVWVHGLGDVMFDNKGIITEMIGTIQDITINKISHKQLVEGHEKLLKLTDKVSAAIFQFEVDKEGNMSFPFMSKGIEQLTPGLTTQQIMKDASLAFERAHPEDLQSLLSDIEVSKQNLSDWQAEYRVIAPEGEIRWFKGRAHPETGENGKVVWYGYLEDVTERKSSEEELIRLSSILEATSDYVGIVSLTQQAVYLNKAGRKVFGCGETEDISKYKMSDFSPTWTNELIEKEAIPNVLKKGKWLGETAKLSKNGVEIPVSQVIIMHKNNIGEPQYFSTICRDISDRKLAETALLDTQQRYKNLLDNMNDGFIMDDLSGKVIFANSIFLKIFGLEFEDIGKMLLEDYIAPKYQNIIRERHTRRIKGERVSNFFEYQGIKKDGTIIWVEDHTSEIIENGIIVGTQSIIRDITERKVHKEKLEHQNKELRKANSELDRFVYSASHDLRAPLKSMLGLIAITQENNAPNTEQFLQLEMLNKSVVKLDNFIEDILHYSRNSRTEIVKEEIEFAEMINEIRASHHFMDGSIDLQMSVEIRNHEKFFSDNRRVNVILNNLISNAIKYQDNTKNGKSFVRIDVDCLSDKAIIIVEDNGIGIAENDIDKVFEMFYRATKLSSGSGLGLYIIKETVEKLNGKITIETELSKGTKLTIEIPNQKN